MGGRGGPLENHLMEIYIACELFREIREMAKNDKKNERKQERMRGGVVNLPIPNAPIELAQNGFRRQRRSYCVFAFTWYFSRFPFIALIGSGKKGVQTSEMVSGAVSSQRMRIFSTDGILLGDKDSRLTGYSSRESCAENNVALQAVSP